MMAANYRHIGGGENRLGRHYSRFSGIWPTSVLADQSLTLRNSQNPGSNRSSRLRPRQGGGSLHSGTAHVAFGSSDSLGPCDFKDFVAQSHTPNDHCVRFVVVVAFPNATLVTKQALPLTWAGLSPAGPRQLRLAHRNPSTETFDILMKHDAPGAVRSSGALTTCALITATCRSLLYTPSLLLRM